MFALDVLYTKVHYKQNHIVPRYLPHVASSSWLNVCATDCPQNVICGQGSGYDLDFF